MPRASKGQVGPQISPTECLGEGRVGRSYGSPWPPGSPPPSPGYINIYLGKAKVNHLELLQDSACLLGGLAIKGILRRILLAIFIGKQDLGSEGGYSREGSDHHLLGPAPSGLSFPFNGPRTRGPNLTHLCPPTAPSDTRARPGCRRRLPEIQIDFI